MVKLVSHKDLHIDMKTYKYLLDMANKEIENDETDKLVDYYGITEYDENELYVGDKVLVPDDIETRSQILDKLYKGFPAGRDKLYDIVISKFVGISRRDIASYLNHNSTHNISPSFRK